MRLAASKSGRVMLDAIVAGQTDPIALAVLAQGTARQKTPELREALRGRITEHHRTMLRLHLQVVDALQRTLADLDAAVGKALAPIRQRARLLTTMPGTSDLTANVVVAEIGVDMSRFPTAGHLISWAGLCPRSDESAGKCRQAPQHTRAQERHLDQDHLGHRRLLKRLQDLGFDAPVAIHAA
jgi:transposase